MTYIPEQDSMVVGGRKLTRLSSLITLWGRTNAGGSASNTGFRIESASSGYQVPVSFKLRIVAYRVRAITENTASISYCDNDLGIASNTAATNQVFLAGTSTVNAPLWWTDAYQGGQEGSIDFVIPAGKYVAITGLGESTTFSLYGYLEAA